MARGASTSFMHRLELRNGRCTVDPGPTIEAASIRTLAALAACRNSPAFGSGAWGALGVCDGSDRRPATGHLHARLARILVARRPVVPIGTFSARSRTWTSA